MLWYKSWLETRWRFVIGLVVLVCSGAAAVLWYPEVVKQLPLAATVDLNGIIGRQIREGAELAREYRGYVWWQWFRQSLRETWTIFAVLLGTGGLLSQTSGGAALFTLSMPASRTRLLGVRAATGLAKLLVLAIVPARRAAALAGHRADLQCLGRSRARRLSVHRWYCFLQPGVSAVDGLQRCLASGGHRARALLCPVIRRAGLRRDVPLRHSRGHERAELFPRRRATMVRAACRHDGVRSHAVRGDRQYRAQGFLGVSR
jgi:hypothetical protein